MKHRGSAPYILPVIVFAQFAGTSLWFAPNAVISELSASLELDSGAISSLTSSVQLGFIIGTLFFSIFNLSDRFSPRLVFLLSALFGSICNLGVVLISLEFNLIMLSRFLTGFFLAGIYPVGMKIAADWYERGLGMALGYLVGALVLGTAFPHLIRYFGASIPWTTVIWTVSALAAFGAILLFLFVREGPHRSQHSPLKLTAFMDIFRISDFRAAAFGYFGHMWELYAFWAFVPVLIASYIDQWNAPGIDVSFVSFLVIAAGSAGCIVGGYISNRMGSARVAVGQLSVSGACCLIAPVLFYTPPVIFLPFLVIWGIFVVGDSPQFSTLNAMTAPKEFVGTALTIATCIGFSITIASIQLLSVLTEAGFMPWSLLILFAGPVFGLFSSRRLLHGGQP
jgi:MFS family permease